jgi:hypothetical protein
MDDFDLKKYLVENKLTKQSIQNEGFMDMFSKSKPTDTFQGNSPSFLCYISVMKFSHEVPLCLLEDSLEFNDYDYALVHLLDKDKDYVDFFMKAKQQGRYIILDNSLHELGHSLP